MKHYHFHPKVVLRTPLLPRYSCFSTKELENLFTDPIVQEAIFLSSPNLYSKLKACFEGAIDDQKEIENLLLSLTKYLLRMSNRCTPFGLFAGCSILDWSPNSSIVLAEKDQLKRKTRLDMKFICEWIQDLEKQETLKTQLTYFPNQTIYEFQDKYRYIEFFLNQGRRFHQISAIGKNEYISEILAAAKQGATIKELSALICDEEISESDANDFLNQMIDAQLLLSELQANVTGPSPTIRMENILSQKVLQNTNLHYQALQNISQQICRIDQQKRNTQKGYQSIQNQIESIGITFQEGKLFQTDYLRSLEQGQLSTRLKNDLFKACKILQRLSPPKEQQDLSKFKDAFQNRYEDIEVPLVEVLDTESGIGYPVNTGKINNRFVDDLSFPTGKSDSKIIFDDWQNFLFQLAITALQNNSSEIDLKDHVSQLDQLNRKTKLPLGNSLGIFFSILGKKGEKEKILIKGISGPSNTKLIARFANDFEEMNKLVTELAKQEEEWFQQKDQIVAEVIHLSEARVGNVLFRPHLRKYEIPYLAKSTLPVEQQIEITDLLVSVQNGSVVLRSKKLNKRVIPRISCAHAFWQEALPIYHFLGDLQSQEEITDLFFNWGKIASKFPSLPRVKFGNLYFAAARWNLTKKDLENWKSKTIEGTTLWREKLNLPEKVFFVEDDNKLLIDFRERRSIEVFSEAVKNKTAIILEEDLREEENAFVTDQNGFTYSNELIAFINKEQTSEIKFKPKQFSTPHSKTIRTFSPGSKWIYYKLYCGIQLQDQLLVDLIQGFMADPKIEDHIDKWFFIRFYDPDPHLRVRFLLKDARQFGYLIQAFNDRLKKFQTNKIIRKIQLEEYNRELERYGSNTIESVESLFSFDSQATCQFIHLLEEDIEESVRPLFALKSIDALLNDFGFSLKGKIELFEFLSSSFGKEFSINATLRKQINKKYKDLHSDIFACFSDDFEHFPFLPAINEILESRTQKQKKFVAQILKTKAQDQLKTPLLDLASSLIHMLCNRLFIDQQRAHELVVYFLLLKYYKELFYRNV